MPASPRTDTTAAAIVVDDETGDVTRCEPIPDNPGAVRETRIDTLEGARAGPVRITRPDGSTEVRPPYAAAELRRIIKQGYEEPRELPDGIAVQAFANQVRSDEDLAAMEKWFNDGCCVPEADR